MSHRQLVPQDRIELSTYPLPRGCATTTLLRHLALSPRGTAAITHASTPRKGVGLISYVGQKRPRTQGHARLGAQGELEAPQGPSPRQRGGRGLADQRVNPSHAREDPWGRASGGAGNCARARTQKALVPLKARCPPLEQRP